jgi:mannose-1-phosphate guanylyltransferase
MTDAKVAVMIFGAGLGTRLRPLTQFQPKPLVYVGDRTLLEHALTQVQGVAKGRVVVNTFHLAANYEALPGTVNDLLEFVHEERLLGTAGGLCHATRVARTAAFGEGDVLVWNGDMMSDFAPRALLTERARRPDAEALLVLTPRPVGQGNVGLDAAGRVCRLRDVRAPTTVEVRGGDFLGIHLLAASLRRELPMAGCLVGDVYIPAMLAGRDLRALEHGGAFLDVGTLDAYVEANRRWLQHRGATAFVHPSARVEGRVLRSVVGAGTKVDGDVVDSIVWPSTSVRGTLEGCIAGPAFRVQR